jgi:hypothetical protein
MNTKEIAKSVNKTERAVRNWITRLAEKSSVIKNKISVSSPMKPADYTIDETILIIEVGLGKNAAMIYSENAKSKIGNIQTSGNEPEYVKRGMELIFGAIGKLDDRLSKIESKIEERQSLLPAPNIKPRDHISKLVREFAYNNKIPYSKVWTSLYRDFGYRTNSNVIISAKNRGMEIIEYIETEGMIETLESVAIELFL